MKTTALVASALGCALLFAAPADADTARKAKTYRIKFSQVANTCEGTGISLTNADLKISPTGKKTALQVSIPMIPIMKGRAGKKGKFSARAKKGKTGIEGLSGAFSISGSVTETGAMKLIFFAEYFKGDTPMCTTSWNGKGVPK